jgi:hypothetical protein
MISKVPKNVAEMWHYSWYKCGYTNIHPGNFQNVVDLCFPSQIHKCESNCEELVFMLCAFKLPEILKFKDNIFLLEVFYAHTVQLKTLKFPKGFADH